RHLIQTLLSGGPGVAEGLPQIEREDRRIVVRRVVADEERVGTERVIDVSISVTDRSESWAVHRRRLRVIDIVSIREADHLRQLYVGLRCAEVVEADHTVSRQCRVGLPD